MCCVGSSHGGILTIQSVVVENQIKSNSFGGSFIQRTSHVFPSNSNSVSPKWKESALQYKWSISIGSYCECIKYNISFHLCLKIPTLFIVKSFEWVSPPPLSTNSSPFFPHYFCQALVRTLSSLSHLLSPCCINSQLFCLLKLHAAS